VNLPIGGEATVQVGWRAWEHDSVRIQAEVGIYFMRDENPANNMASRWIDIQPRPVFAPGEYSGAKFDEPRQKPGSARIVFSFRLKQPSPTQLIVRDAQTRRRLRVWRWPMLPAGPHSVVWDRRDSTGVRAVAGYYRCVLLLENDSVPQPLVLGD